jgi:OOP family OmpA-OmpF porin
MRHALRLLAVAAALVIAAGCSNRYLDDARASKPQGSAFEAALARDYLAMAKSESKYNDQRDTTTFARRSTAAAEGQLVLPDDLTNRKIPSRYRTDLRDARQRLVTALDQNGRTKAPDAAASAQVLYDCWVEQAEESLQPDDLKACRDGFERSLSQVEYALAQAPAAVPVEAASYLVFFDLNSAKLSPEATEIVTQAVETAKNRPDEPVMITGFTDTTGTPQYNLRLSKRRAQSVADGMVARGIDAGRLTTKGVGENDLLVPTGDGVAEPQNRRAQIAIGR